MESVAEVTEKYEQILQKKDHLLEIKNALIEKLEAELRLLRIKIYRSKSEKQLDSPQQNLFRQDLFNELEQLADEPNSTDEQTDDTTEVKAHKRKARKSQALSPELPRVEVLHDLPEHEKRCQCGLPKKR